MHLNGTQMPMLVDLFDAGTPVALHHGCVFIFGSWIEDYRHTPFGPVVRWNIGIGAFVSLGQRLLHCL